MRELSHAKVIKKTITIEYSCDESVAKHSVKLTDFKIGNGEYYDDWQYDYVRFICPVCGKEHMREI